MGKITNIYVTTDYKKNDWSNSVFIEVLYNCRITRIKSTKHGYIECNNEHFSEDYWSIINRVEEGTAIDLMKDASKAYRIYTDGKNKAIFVDANTKAVSMPFKQIVYIKNNSAYGTKSIYGGEDASKPYFLDYEPTNEIISKAEIINGIVKEVKDCFPELKITLKETNQNANE